MNRFHRFALAALCMIVLGSAGAVAAADETADCIAVMQGRADDLARQVRAGDAAQEPALRAELQRAAALIGRAYLDGHHDEAEARAKLEQAQRAQATMAEAERASLHAACVRKADAELEAASGLQRYVVTRIAQARLNRMLAPQ